MDPRDLEAKGEPKGLACAQVPVDARAEWYDTLGEALRAAQNGDVRVAASEGGRPPRGRGEPFAC